MRKLHYQVAKILSYTFIEDNQIANSPEKLDYEPNRNNRKEIIQKYFPKPPKEPEISRADYDKGFAKYSRQGLGQADFAIILGKFIENDDFYNRASATLDKINKMIDDVNAGNGTLGKFLKDPSLYDNGNKAIANIKQLTDDINAGKGSIGKLARDQQFADKLQNTMNRLSNLSDKLDEGNGSAALFLRDRAVYDNTNKLLTDTQDLIKAIRQNPKKYLTIHLKVF